MGFWWDYDGISIWDLKKRDLPGEKMDWKWSNSPRLKMTNGEKCWNMQDGALQLCFLVYNPIEI